MNPFISYAKREVTKNEAKARGRKRYFTGRPCKYGHWSERYVSNDVCVACTVSTHKENVRKATRKRNDIPQPDYPSPGYCECCGKSEKANGRGLAVDHDHDSGVFRGWLCSLCNTGIGALGDDLNGVERAVLYLQGVEARFMNDEPRWIAYHCSGEQFGRRGLFTKREYAVEVVKRQRSVGEIWFVKEITGLPEYDGLLTEK